MLRRLASAAAASVVPRQTVQPLGSMMMMCGAQRRGVYSAQVREHFNNPKNVGKVDPGREDVGTGVVGAPACGDMMQLQVVVDENGIIKEAYFKAFGCAAAIASSSLATTALIGKTITEARKITNKEIAYELKLPPVKKHCSLLAEEGVKAALDDIETKHARRRVAVPAA